MTTPFGSSVHLYPIESDLILLIKKDMLDASLRYAIHCTRPNIAFAVEVLNRFTRKPDWDHWHAIVGIMKYLVGTKNYGLTSTLLFLKVIVMSIEILYQVPLFIFLDWVVMLYVLEI